MVQLKSSDSVPKTRDQMVSFCSYQAITVLGLMFFTPLSIFFMDQERSIPNTRASSTTNKIQTTKSEQWTEVPRPPTPSEAAMIASLVKENDICQGKEPLLEILLRAGQDKVTEAECELLPTWEEVVSVYGEEPVVYGLESCKQYREHVARTSDLEPQVRVAGLFNTGQSVFGSVLDLCRRSYHHLSIIQEQTRCLNRSTSTLPPSMTRNTTTTIPAESTYRRSRSGFRHLK